MSYISHNNKNKVKLDSPGELLALATRNQKVFVHKEFQFKVVDYNIGIKIALYLLVILDIFVPEQCKLDNFYKS